MKSVRLSAISRAKDATIFGLVLGTLGRQGNPPIFDRLRVLLRAHGKQVIPFLMAELNPGKLALISVVQVWVQVACPRLSIDWSGGFDKPILTPYELEVALEETPFLDVYPMNYYSANGGPYTNFPYRPKS
jgi:2-(3-amino-3-carboxypropyl)histidine synthase